MRAELCCLIAKAVADLKGIAGGSCQVTALVIAKWHVLFWKGHTVHKCGNHSYVVPQNATLTSMTLPSQVRGTLSLSAAMLN